MRTASTLGRRSFLSSFAAPALLGAAPPPPDQSSATKETILAFGAHPADVIGACGGTLLKHARRGDRVVAAPLTMGVGHLWHPQGGIFGRQKNEETARLKTVEQARQYYHRYVEKVYEELKPVELHLLGLNDSPLAIDVANLRTVAKLIREIRPSIVMTHHPGMAILAGHPDHRDAGELVLRAVMFAQEETFEESVDPLHVVSGIYCYPNGKGDRWQSLGQSDVPNVYVDVSETAEAKQKAWLAQGALFGVTPESVKDLWNRTAQPGYPHVEAFVRSRPVVVDYLRSNPGRPWLGG